MAGYGRIIFITGSASNYRSLLSSRSGIQHLQSFTTLKWKALEKLGLPPKPKKPMSAYFRFLKIERKKLDIEEPNMSNPDKLRKMADRWAKCDVNEKNVLRMAYNIDMLNYSKQMMTYEQSITPEQKEMMEEVVAKEKIRIEKLLLKKKCNELGKPKKPSFGFFRFLQENKYTKSKDTKCVEWTRDLAEKWRGMTEEEKATYKMEGQKLMVQYKEDMRVWEENMIRKGHMDVVRNRGVIEIKCDTANAV